MASIASAPGEQTTREAYKHSPKPSLVPALEGSCYMAEAGDMYDSVAACISIMSALGDPSTKTLQLAVCAHMIAAVGAQPMSQLRARTQDADGGLLAGQSIGTAQQL